MAAYNAQEASAIRKGDSYRLSWTAYVWPALLYASVSAVLVLVGRWLPTIAASAWALATALLALRVLYLRSVELYTDAAGVWVFRGIFPWSKGHYGVRWRDVEEAVMYTGMLAYFTRSYRVRVGHRYTRGSEIDLPSVHGGNAAVIGINKRHEMELKTNMAIVLHDALEMK